MAKKVRSIFPNLPDGIWTKLNLNEESKKMMLDYLNPEVCKSWVYYFLHSKHSTDYSYGGFLEDRSNIWKYSYLKNTEDFIHLGVDYNVPAGTEVALPKRARVHDVFRDKDQNGGWGGRAIFQLSPNKYLILGHLEHHFSYRPGQTLERGTIVGKTAQIKENGGWFPHLHVQLVTQTFLDQFPNLRNIDGYAKKGSPLIGMVRDPENLISLY